MSDIDTITYNTQLASRQRRMNEYAYQNKMDTLFFFQILLISLLILAMFAYGASLGFFSMALVLYIALILLLMNILLFIGRQAYTLNLRDPEIWGRKRFNVEQAVTPSSTKAATSTDESNAFSWSGKFGLPTDVSGVDISGLCAAFTK
jgi:hypothetical protein